MINKLYWRARIILLALRWVNKFNLGDEVIYNGKKYLLLQGVNKPYWDLGSVEVLGSTEVDGGYLKRIHESEFRKTPTLFNYWFSFRSGYRFYMTSWYKIWVREGIKPWMRGCNIWGK